MRFADGPSIQDRYGFSGYFERNQSNSSTSRKFKQFSGLNVCLLPLRAQFGRCGPAAGGTVQSSISDLAETKSEIGKAGKTR